MRRFCRSDAVLVVDNAGERSKQATHTQFATAAQKMTRQMISRS